MQPQGKNQTKIRQSVRVLPGLPESESQKLQTTGQQIAVRAAGKGADHTGWRSQFRAQWLMAAKGMARAFPQTRCAQASRKSREGMRQPLGTCEAESATRRAISGAKWRATCWYTSCLNSTTPAGRSSRGIHANSENSGCPWQARSISDSSPTYSSRYHFCNFEQP